MIVWNKRSPNVKRKNFWKWNFEYDDKTYTTCIVCSSNEAVAIAHSLAKLRRYL